ARVGTLAVTFSSLASPGEGAATVRTTTAVAGGRAGLAYGATPFVNALEGPAYLAGLRQSANDRTNVAIQNVGTEGAIVLRLTVFSGDPASPVARTLPEELLAPGAFKQLSAILASNGLSIAQGYVLV